MGAIKPIRRQQWLNAKIIPMIMMNSPLQAVTRVKDQLRQTAFYWRLRGSLRPALGLGISSTRAEFCDALSTAVASAIACRWN